METLGREDFGVKWQQWASEPWSTASQSEENKGKHMEKAEGFNHW